MLDAATSSSVRREDDKVTYINKGKDGDEHFDGIFYLKYYLSLLCLLYRYIIF